jgi:hypothetical protein
MGWKTFLGVQNIGGEVGGAHPQKIRPCWKDDVTIQQGEDYLVVDSYHLSNLMHDDEIIHIYVQYL